MGHEYFELMKEVSRMENASPEFQEMWKTLQKWLDIEDVNFNKRLSKKDEARNRDAHEKFAATMEKYVMSGKNPSPRLKKIFSKFKEWLKAVYKTIRNIKYVGTDGETHSFNLNDNIRSVMDTIFSEVKTDDKQKIETNEKSEIKEQEPVTAKTEDNTKLDPETKKVLEDIAQGKETVPGVNSVEGTQNTQEETNTNELGDENEEVKLGDVLPKEVIKRLEKLVKGNKAQETPTPKKKEVKGTPPPPPRYTFENPETEKRYRDATRGYAKGVDAVKKFVRKVQNNFKGAYPYLTQKDLLKAKGTLEIWKKQKQAAKYRASELMMKNLEAFQDNPVAFDAFNRVRLLQDLLWRKKDRPNAELPFGFTGESAQEAYNKLLDELDKHPEDKKIVFEAIKAEEALMADTTKRMIDLGKKLGLRLDKVLRNPHYYRHSVLEYINSKGKFSKAKGTPKGFFEGQMYRLKRRDYLKRYKGSPLDINADYAEANLEVRSQLFEDIATMEMLVELKKQFDIAPKLLEQIRNSRKNNEKGSFNQDENLTALSDIIPDGYEIWNPSGSGILRSTSSTYENVLNKVINTVSEETGIPMDTLLSNFVDDGEFNQLMVLPTELTSTLKDIVKEEHDIGSWLEKIAKNITDMWKKTVLYTPSRFIRWSTRNFFGDLDATLAGNPTSLKYTPRAIKEITDFLYKHKEATPDLQDFLERNGGGLSIQSLQTVDADTNAVKKLVKELSREAAQIRDTKGAIQKTAKTGKVLWDTWGKYYKVTEKAATWRESILRYANYLSYKEQMEKNNGNPNNYGASLRAEIDAIADIKDKAFKMSNELIGDYDNLSKTGKKMRKMLIPFYSWLEMNARRYSRLIRNSFNGDSASELVRRLTAGQKSKIPFHALAATEGIAKMSMLTLLLTAFNRIVFPDEDDELPPDVQTRPHLTLGKYNGRVYYYERVGALSDFADWFALDSVYLDAKEMINGQLSLGQYAKKVATAPMGKVLNAITPAIKTPIELAIGKTIYPDPFNSRPIRDNFEYVVSSLDPSDVGLYRWFRGKPRRSENIPEFIADYLSYSINSEETAYFSTLDKVRQYQERVLGQEFDGFMNSPRGQALYNFKIALRVNDKAAAKRYLKEYMELGGTKQGLKTSFRNMNPLHGLNKAEEKKFMRWLTPEEKRTLRKAQKYYKKLARKKLL